MSKYQIEPVADRVFVRRGAAIAKTAGGLVLPDKSQEASRTGIVEAVGPGMWANSSDGPVRLPLQCTVGVKVLLPASAEIIRLNPEDEKDELVVCQECQLLAILR